MPANDGWIETWTGRRVYPTRPDIRSIYLEDVAHGLSNNCRYNGQSRFYSVAEHSVHLADWCLARGLVPLVAMNALLHDAAEAYLPDVPTPIKCLFPLFSDCEDRLLQTIFQALGVRFLEGALRGQIKGADLRIVLNEREAAMPRHSGDNLWNVEELEPLEDVQIHCWPPDEAEDNFLSCFRELAGELA